MLVPPQGWLNDNLDDLRHFGMVKHKKMKIEDGVIGPLPPVLNPWGVLAIQKLVQLPDGSDTVLLAVSSKEANYRVQHQTQEAQRYHHGHYDHETNHSTHCLYLVGFFDPGCCCVTC